MQMCEFQEMMRCIYFKRDSERGVKETYNWLVDEVKELGDAIEKRDAEEMELEFADVIAWLSSLANITGVNLEKAALKKYSNRCPKCKESPCKCTF